MADRERGRGFISPLISREVVCFDDSLLGIAGEVEAPSTETAPPDDSTRAIAVAPLVSAVANGSSALASSATSANRRSRSRCRQRRTARATGFGTDAVSGAGFCVVM